MSQMISMTSGSGAGTGPSQKFPSPWLDYSTVAIPDNHQLVMWWAQYLWLSDGNFNTSMKRVAAHFITEIEFPDLEPDEETEWKDFFKHHLDYRRELFGAAQDYLAYGNSFVSPYLPFKRFLSCQQCYLDRPIERVDYRLDFVGSDPWLAWRAKAPCPKCGSSGDYKVVDRRDPDLSKFKLNRYDPNDIELAYNRFSQKKEFYWRIPDHVRRDIQQRARIHVDTTPIEVLQAVSCQGRLRFDDDMMLHQSEISISGIRSHGWGIPGSIANFRAAWLQQLTNKLDQAVAIDYTLGMRVLSPTPTPGQTDPMQTLSMNTFVSHTQGIVQSHRANPVGMYTSPFPLQYQFMGGEGGNLLPPEKLKFRQQEYLNQLGVPIEYHQMSMNVQAAPMALRLFEAYWQAIPAFYNKILTWVVDLLSRTYALEATEVVMQKTTIADDMERKAVLLQLMSANQISPQTALRPFNVDAHGEAKRVLQQQDYVAKLQQEFAEKDAKRQEMGALKGMAQDPTPMALAQQGQPGAAPAGGTMPGAPAAGGGAQGGTLQAMSDQAQQIAEQLVGMDEYSRKQELKALRTDNKDLHALVTQKMEDIRSQAQSQGGQMLLAQGGAQAGPAPA